MELSGHPSADLIEELLRRGAKLVTAGEGLDEEAKEVEVTLPILIEIGEEVFESGIDEET